MVDAARLELTREYFMHLEQLSSDYHNHKENMANSGLVVQIGLFAAISSSEIWPPAWMVPIPIAYVGILAPPQQAWAVYSVLWLAIHLFVRWQLNNRSIAALYVKCSHEELLTWLHTEPSDEDLAPYKKHELHRSDDTIEGDQEERMRSLRLWQRQVVRRLTWVGLETCACCVRFPRAQRLKLSKKSSRTFR